MLLFVGVPLLLIILGAAGAYFSGLADPLTAMMSGEGHAEEPAMPEGEHAAEGAKAPAEGGALGKEGAVGSTVSITGAVRSRAGDGVFAKQFLRSGRMAGRHEMGVRHDA